MGEVVEEIIQELKRRNIFSEYLPKSYQIDFESIGSLVKNENMKDVIEPYSYTMSRFGKKGDRRKISVPAPSAYYEVIRYLEIHKEIIDDFVELAIEDDNSFSRIVTQDGELVIDDGGYASPQIIEPNIIINTCRKFVPSMMKKIRDTKGACGILHIDISEFYGSIYTHAITAIKLGVDGALQAFNSDSKDPDYLLYKGFDCKTRNLNGKRTNGLLTGPYLSKVISEALLARVDEELRNRNLVFTRYADDYEFAVYDEKEIDSMKAVITEVFDKYFFKINNEKTNYEEYPFYIYNDFERILGKYVTDKNNVDICELFNRFWALEKAGDKGAVRYLMKVYKSKYNVTDKNTYSDYLVSVICNDEKAFGLACEIYICEYETGRVVMDEATYQLLLKKLDIEIKNSHEYETIWLVYLLLYTGHSMSISLFEKLWKTEFDLLRVLLLHECRNVVPEEDLNKLLNECYLENESWILMYEVTLITRRFDDFYELFQIKSSKNFYQMLYDNGFSFYSKRIVPNMDNRLIRWGGSLDTALLNNLFI